MTKRTTIPAVLAIMLFASVAASADEGRRGAMFQIGAGTMVPVYDADTEEFFDYMEASPGVDRVKVSLDLALGFGVSPNGIILGRVDGTGDRVYDDFDFIQMNLYLYSIGYRHYPMRTGLYLEAGAGRAVAVIQSSTDTDIVSDPGFGFGVALGYDFNPELRGFGLTVELKYDSYDIEGSSQASLAFLGNLCWK